MASRALTAGCPPALLFKITTFPLWPLVETGISRRVRLEQFITKVQLPFDAASVVADVLLSRLNTDDVDEVPSKMAVYEPLSDSFLEAWRLGKVRLV